MTFAPTPGHDPHCRDTALAVLAFANDHPMPPELAEQVGAWIAPHAIAAGITYDHAMRCAAIAYPLIREHLATCVYDTDPIAAVAPAAAPPSGLSDAELLATVREPDGPAPNAGGPVPPPYPVQDGGWASWIGNLGWHDLLAAHKFGPLAFGVREALVRRGIDTARIEIDGAVFPDQEDPRTRIEIRIAVAGQPGARDGWLTRTLVDKGAPCAMADLGHDEIAESMIARLTVAEKTMPVIPTEPEPLTTSVLGPAELDGLPVFGQQAPPHLLVPVADAPPPVPATASTALDETGMLGAPIPVAVGVGAAVAPGQTWQM